SGRVGFSPVNQLPRTRDLERPLGQDLKRPVRPRRIPAIDLRSLGTAIAALCMIVAAGAISLRERPFRIPAEVVTTTPQTVARATAGEAKTAEAPAKLNSENDPAAPTQALHPRVH